MGERYLKRMKIRVLVLLPLLALGATALCGCGASLANLVAVDGIRGGDVCGEIGLDACKLRSGYLEAGDFSVPAPGFLSSQSLADGYLFRALQTGPARVGMTSSQLDPLVSVYRVLPDETIELLGEDDDAGYLQNSSVRFPAEEGQEYLIVATSYGFDVGRYRLIYSENLYLADDSYQTIGPLLPTRKIPIPKTADDQVAAQQKNKK
jgi:hypothetical protein